MLVASAAPRPYICSSLKFKKPQRSVNLMGDQESLRVQSRGLLSCPQTEATRRLVSFLFLPEDPCDAGFPGLWSVGFKAGPSEW
jgi:hypothetical protein